MALFAITSKIIVIRGINVPIALLDDRFSEGNAVATNKKYINTPSIVKFDKIFKRFITNWFFLFLNEKYLLGLIHLRL